jgi:peptide/nickel transport system substrate-binding protein
LTSAPPQDLPPVTMGAFIPVRYRPGEQMILVRNPYYWQVDEEGRQLLT